MSNTAEIFTDAISAFNNRDLKRAEELFRSVIKTDESHIAALNLLTVVLMMVERFAEAEPFIARATSLNQQSDVSFYNYGLISKHLNKPQGALENFSKAIALNPNIAETWNNRGTVLNDLNKYDLAISDFDKAITINSQYGEAYANKGKSLTLLKRYDEASAAYDKALSIRPDLENAWLGRGNVSCDLKRYDEAFAAYDKALSIKPDLEDAWIGRGNVFWSLQRYDEAFAAYDKALSIKPDLENAWLGRGNVFWSLKRYDEAFAAYHNALALKPACAQAHYNEGLLRLTLGEFEPGWAKYEYRWETQTQQVWKRNFSQPLWLGDSDIKDKTILLHAEQGLGDTLLACRYIPNFAALAAKVILEVHSPLKPLLRGLKGVSMLIGRGEAIPHFDVHCPLMSLPLAFGTTIETIPSTVPYINVPTNAIEKWRSKLSAQKLKVGIAWAGNPDFVRDRDRSILLKNILPVTRIDGVKYFSLQKYLRHGDDELLNANPHIVRVDKEINDFQDTAAIMMSLDLVISSDTSIVNLAGALGRPVWVLLPFISDWRWLLDRDDTPWYPTARLFRQANVGDWSTVLDDVCTALKQLVDHGSSPIRAQVKVD